MSGPSIKVVVLPPAVIRDSDPGQANGAVGLTLQISGLSNARASVGYFDNLQGMLSGGFSIGSALSMLFALWADEQHAQQSNAVDVVVHALAATATTPEPPAPSLTAEPPATLTTLAASVSDPSVFE